MLHVTSLLQFLNISCLGKSESLNLFTGIIKSIVAFIISALVLVKNDALTKTKNCININTKITL